MNLFRTITTVPNDSFDAENRLMTLLPAFGTIMGAEGWMEGANYIVRLYCTGGEITIRQGLAWGYGGTGPTVLRTVLCNGGVPHAEARKIAHTSPQDPLNPGPWQWGSIPTCKRPEATERVRRKLNGWKVDVRTVAFARGSYLVQAITRKTGTVRFFAVGEDKGGLACRRLGPNMITSDQLTREDVAGSWPKYWVNAVFGSEA